MSLVQDAVQIAREEGMRGRRGGGFESQAARLPIVYVYPHCRWDMLPPARHRFLMEAMSAHTQVIFMDAPRDHGSFANARRPRVERISASVTLVHDALSLRYTRVGKRLGRIGMRIDGRRVDRALARAGVHEYVYWVSAPDPALLDGMQSGRVVYDCIDPCFSDDVLPSFDRSERGIAGRASVVFCTAHTLLERMSALHPNCRLLPNACHFEEYRPEALRGLATPAPLRGRSRPVVGFMGTIDWRVDLAIVAEAARRLPEYTFAVVGRINNDQRAAADELGKMANVVVTGAVPYDEGRAYTAAFDVGLIPFHPGRVGDAINPVKMYMYLAAGKPVVSTWCTECVRAAPLVSAAKGAEGFAAAIRHAVENDTAADREDRIAFASRNAWADRAREATAVLDELGLFRPTASPANKEGRH